eukprot:1190498-Prorocentrum_minimum.AAC.3
MDLQVTLKIAVRLDEILPGKLGLEPVEGETQEAPPIQDCTQQANCQLLSLSDEDYNIFLKTAAIIVNPVTAAAEAEVARSVVVSALSRGTPVLVPNTPALSGCADP